MSHSIKKLVVPLGTILILSFGIGLPAFAVDDLGLMELEGNAVQDAVLPGAEDWETMYDSGANTGGSSSVFTGIKPDVAPISIFTGGRKDIQEISQWGHKDGSVPDKDDITNAYAAAFNHNGDLVVYFGADRITNVGDAFLGFWFFKDQVTAEPDGSFSGDHSFDDTLVLVNFPQANNAVPYIAVVTWDPSCPKAASNNPSPGQCAAKNLRLQLEGSGANGAVCGTVPAGDNACAITNDGDENAPWPYTFKDGTSGTFPMETFFEGGINLSAVLGGEACFASFMAESRSSSSFTASLKDFSLDSFPVCGVEITKNCTQGNVNSSETGFVYDFDGVVTNTGFGTLYNVTVTDVTGGQTFDLGDLGPLASAPYSGTFESTQNGPMNVASVTAASSSGGPQDISDGPVTAQCPAVSRSPMIDVSKNCTTRLMEMDGKVVVVVDFTGQVCNTTGGSSGLDPIGLINVDVTDDGGTPLDPADDQTFDIGVLAADSCAPYSGSYGPGSTNSTDPSQAMFSDTVTATGTALLGFGDVEASRTATCPLCP